MRELIVYGLENSFARVIRCLDDLREDLLGKPRLFG